MQPPLQIVTRDPLLRQALTRHLASQFPLAADANGLSMGHASVILTTTTDMRPEHCAEIVARGDVVVVLTAVPRDHEQSLYLAAGVNHYLAMTLEPGELEAAIHHASAPLLFLPGNDER